MVWERAKQKLQETITQSVYKLWIEPLGLHNRRGAHLFLSCPDKYFKAFVSQNFLAAITEAVVHEDQSIEMVHLQDAGRIDSDVSKPVQLQLPQMVTGTSQFRSLHPRYTFAEFMVGAGNILAQSACRAVCSLDDSIGPCLYINSTTGLGKTHLTHAIAHELLSTAPLTRLHYLTAQQFAAEMVANIRSNEMEGFKRKYQEQCDILLIEDIQSLIGKKKTQQELNEVLDTLIKSGKRIVLTANKGPRELSDIDDDFRSRMTSGLVTSIKQPDLETRRRIVRIKAAAHNIRIEDHFVDHIAQHIKGDVRRLESAVIALRARAVLANGKIDEAMVDDSVASLVGRTQELNTRAISEMVGRQFAVSMGEMESKSRKKSISYPRQVAMYLSRKHTDQTLADIGKIFKRDHSTVLHAVKVIGDLKRRDTSVSAQLDLLSERVRQL
ncbi:MAG: chromosomal replication initiator protein DnaA [Desulfofustis sp. PB-SRB1]|jgi:chromosomal replication initiator protein|nr:chromosomal replication initiator protein DnaA [Desulfofustis sp. PB-SRB1]MBM1002247.1 chromosomal replication initiator protein DnaA [Desulfofustis sp. PB-SRB1]HBH29282.1 chromosomal replication initiator protein DnaA [Desulfofustis sp.]HBH31911.1 chromosomal replication initiator protein DnaA [Desulfofustis sp.]